LKLLLFISRLDARL